MSLVIRVETPADFSAISHVNRLAFGRDDEARLVQRLRDGAFARVSLVAEVDARVVGHVLFSNLPIATPASRIAALALAPLAVLPEYQSRGIGSELVLRGLELCRQQGHAMVVVLGRPRFYCRFGFSAELAGQLESPYAGESFLALELTAGSLASITGRVEYPQPFGEL